MCECVKSRHLIAGWLCCTCRAYNGLQRRECKQCGGARCAPLSPDSATREHFETYAEAYANDPALLAMVERELGKNA